MNEVFCMMFIWFDHMVRLALFYLINDQFTALLLAAFQYYAYYRGRLPSELYRYHA